MDRNLARSSREDNGNYAIGQNFLSVFHNKSELKL